MKTLIKKEIRLLLPAWIAAMLLAIIPRVFIILYSSPGNLPYYQDALSFVAQLIFVIGLLFLGINSFGQELSSNTFSALLSQPMERPRIWRVKVATLAVAFISVWITAILLASLELGLYRSYFQLNIRPALSGAVEFLTLSALVAFSGGLWTTLLLRQIIGAFWITLLVPAAILTGIGILGAYLNFSEAIERCIEGVAILIYSAAGFLFARRMFLQAQDIQWTGGNLFFRRRKRKEVAHSFVQGQIRNRYFALVWKEIQLHEAILFIAAIIFAANVTIVVLLPHISNANLKGALEFVWALWLLMPLLIGCASVADERRLGVAESQLCQPVSRQAAFSIKFFVALILSVILGAVMPSIIEWTRNFGITTWWDSWIFIAAPVIFFISFYASTFSRSTVDAVGMAIAVSAAGCFIFLACVMALIYGIRASMENYDSSIGLGRVYLFTGLCLVIFPSLLARLMFWNFRWLHLGWKLFWHNTAVILISLAAIFIVTNLIFFRVWELFGPIEMPHGPARLTAETPIKFSMTDDKMTALLPDGRLWQQGIDFRWPEFRSVTFVRWDRIPATDRFIGSNWTEVSSGYFYTLGIQRNGTLWCIPQIGNKIRMAQIGSDTNWLKVAANKRDFLLLKRNGTLWLWGTNQADDVTNEFARLSRKIKLDLATPSVRLDPGTDWTNLIPLNDYRALARKNDGSFWNRLELFLRSGSSSFHLVQETNLDNQWASYAYNYDFFSAEVKTNGQLWLSYQIDTNLNNNTLNARSWGEGPLVPRYTRRIQLGSDSDWTAVTAGGNSMILLRKDGTLWKWTVPWTSPSEKPFHPVQLGRRSDWIALVRDMGTALAADGSLWSWDDPSDTVWLAPSRKPVFMGNILEGASATKTDAHDNAD